MATYTLTADFGGYDLPRLPAGLLARRRLTSAPGRWAVRGPALALDAPSDIRGFELNSIQPRRAAISFGSLAEIRALRMSSDVGPFLATRVKPNGEGSDDYVWTSDLAPADDARDVLVGLQTPRVGCWKRIVAPTFADQMITEYAVTTTPQDVATTDWTDMTDLMVNVTITVPARIWGILRFNWTPAGGGTAPTCNYRVVIHDEEGIDFECDSTLAISDAGSTSHRSAVLPPGTYEVKGQFRRTAGTQAVRLLNGSLFSMGLQGVAGERGPIGPQGPTGPAGGGGGGSEIPVDGVFVSTVATDPNILLGYGTWTLL